MSHLADDTKLNQVYQLLHSEIEAGQSRNGARLPTDEELAKRLGYSRATVARAMRMLVDQGMVERRKRAGSFVRARQPVATALFGAMIGRTMPIPRADNIFVWVSQEIAHRAEAHAHSLVVHDPGFHATGKAELIERTAAITRQLIQQKVAGVFVLPKSVYEGDDESISTRSVAEFDRAGIPVVLLDRDLYRFPRRSRYDLVGIDNLRAAYLLTSHLISLGCRRIDFIAEAGYVSAARQRIDGYLKALWDHGLETDRRRVQYVEHTPGDLAEPGARPARMEAILRGTDAEALVVANDSLAADLMQVALAIGRRIPDDLRLVGFDDLPQSQYLAVPLTTIRQPCEGLGAAAVQTMIERMRDPARSGVDVIVQSELIVRESCGAVPKRANSPA